MSVVETPPELQFKARAEVAEPLHLFGEFTQGPLHSRFVSVEQAAAWLGGFIDGEGCVSLRRDRRNGTSRGWVRRIDIVNTDPALIETLKDALAVLGVGSRYYVRKPSGNPRHAPQFEIAIMGEANLRRISEIVPIHAPGKKALLLQALSTYSPLPRYAHRKNRRGA